VLCFDSRILDPDNTDRTNNGKNQTNANQEEARSKNQEARSDTMSDLDPATLAKFQKFQAILAASPEIVEALNSPEILAMAAMAAKAAENKLAKPVFQLKPEPEPDYPVVGYGVSDDVSVMSEMTTPTVMTRQTVEEDEFYPEVDVSGQSSSGILAGPRRIGLKIGVSASDDGDLPPPPPKFSKPKGRHHRSSIRKIKPVAPMSKIVENDGSITTEISNEFKSKELVAKKSDAKEFDAKGKPPIPSKKSTWKPITVSPVLKDKKTSGAESARRTDRHSSYNQRIPRRPSQTRGVNRNRSMPVNMKPNSSSSGSSASSGSFQGEDDNTKTSSESNSTPTVSIKKSMTKSLSPTRSSVSKGTITEIEKPSTIGTPSVRGVVRNRDLPVTSKHSYGSVGSVSSGSFFDDDDTTKSSGESAASPFTTEEKSMTAKNKDGKNIFGAKTPSAQSLSKPRSRGRSLSKKKKSSQDNKNSNLISDDDSQGMSSESSNAKSELSDSKSSENFNRRPISSEKSNQRRSSMEKSNQRPSVTRRWKPPVKDDSAIPPAFRSISNHSQKLRLSGSTHSKESRSEEQTDDFSSAGNEDDYVRQTVRKTTKVASRPNPVQYKQHLSETTQVKQGDTSRPGDYLPGSGSPFPGTRRKKATSTKKNYNQPSESCEPRSEDWIGSGKIQKRSWKAKKTLQC